jgi:hypothetical protein
MKKLNQISDILIAIEFKGLTPLECLLKILRENKKKQEENEDN